MPENITNEEMNIEGRKPSIRPIILWAGLFVMAMFAAPLTVQHFDLGHIVMLAAVLCTMLLLIPMVRASTLYAKQISGFVSPAMKNYNKRMFIWMISYAILLSFSLWFFQKYEPNGALLYIIAILPALPMIYCVWTMGQYLAEESDEYVRMKNAQAGLYATGFLLSVASIWGFLEQFDAVPFIPSWIAVPMWAMGLGFGHAMNKVKGA